MNDPIFGGCNSRRSPAPRRQGRAPTPGGVPVQDVRVALEVMSMANTLGYNCALFVYLEGCPYCEKFLPAWNKACAHDDRVLFLHCIVQNMDAARAFLGDVSFPCLVANGRIHQMTARGHTSEMDSDEIVEFALTAPVAGETIEYVDREEASFPVKETDLLSERSDEVSEHASEAVSEDGEEVLDDEFLNADEQDVDERDGFQFNALPQDARSASPDAPIVVCYYWNKCGGCKRFRPEWNSLVQQALDETPTVLFAVADVEQHGKMFERTGSSTVPHIQLHCGGANVHKTGPLPAKALWEWVQQRVR